MNPIIKWVMQTMMKGQTGVMRTLPKKELLDLNVNITIEKLIRNGVDPSTLKTPGQVENIIKQIEKPKVIAGDSDKGRRITEALFGKKGEVVDMTGKKIDTSKPILGGKNVPETDVVADAIATIKSKKPIDAMKEANSVIGRKGKYKNLTPEESKKILKDTEDHIFERDIPIDPEDMADGGIAGMLGERVPFRYGKSYSSKKKSNKDTNNWIRQSIDMMMMPNFREPHNFPYKSLEDIPPKVLEMLRKDPNFDLETFLTKVAWSDPDKTRIQEKRKGKDEPWGMYSPRSDTSFLNYQHFGKSEPIGDGLLSIKSPTDADKVRTVLHEMRHQKMKEPWFMNSSAVPKWVREYEERGEPHYLDKDIEDKFKKHRNTQKNVSGEELYVRFMDQHFGDVAEKGTIAGSDYKPYFDKILKDHWDPYAKRYKEILGEERRVKDRVEGGAYGLADGGVAGLLGERTEYEGGGPARQKFGFGRRAFLKWLGAGAAGIGAAKSGLFGLLKGGGKKQAAKEAIKSAGSGTPPPYFFKLVDKIKMMGDDTLATKDKAIAKKYKDYTMEEDFAGNIEIIKKNNDIAEDVYMSYKVDEVPTKIGKKKSAKVEEYEEFTATPDGDGKMKNIEQGVPDSVVMEVEAGSGNVPESFYTGPNKIKKASGGRVPLSGGGGLFNLLKLLLKRKPKLSYLEKYPRVNIKELMKGKKPIKLYSGVGNREANTLKAYKEIAKDFNTTVDKVKKDNFKGQWWTPFEEYASSFGNPSNIKSKMLTTELTPKEIKLAKRYVEKINKKDKMISRMKMEKIDNPPKYNITTKENTVIIPKIKLKKLKKAGKIDTDYMILEKMKKKLGLAEGGLARMLGE